MRWLRPPGPELNKRALLSGSQAQHGGRGRPCSCFPPVLPAGHASPTQEGRAGANAQRAKTPGCSRSTRRPWASTGRPCLHPRRPGPRGVVGSRVPWRSSPGRRLFPRGVASHSVATHCCGRQPRSADADAVSSSSASLP